MCVKEINFTAFAVSQHQHKLSMYRLSFQQPTINNCVGTYSNGKGTLLAYFSRIALPKKFAVTFQNFLNAASVLNV
jgi:ABC-type enterochelin transport system ATPase subunit